MKKLPPWFSLNKTIYLRGFPSSNTIIKKIFSDYWIGEDNCGESKRYQLSDLHNWTKSFNKKYQDKNKLRKTK